MHTCPSPLPVEPPAQARDTLQGVLLLSQTLAPIPNSISNLFPTNPLSTLLFPRQAPTLCTVPNVQSCKASPCPIPTGGGEGQANSDLQGPLQLQDRVLFAHLEESSSLDFWGPLPQHLLARPVLWLPALGSGLMPACTSRFTAPTFSGLPWSPRRLSGSLYHFLLGPREKGMETMPGVHVCHQPQEPLRPHHLPLEPLPPPPFSKHKTSGHMGVVIWPG